MSKKAFVTKEMIEEIVKTYPTPFHIYDENGIDLVLSIQSVPEFTLAQYKGLKFEKQPVKVTEEDVKTAIDFNILFA